MWDCSGECDRDLVEVNSAADQGTAELCNISCLLENIVDHMIPWSLYASQFLDP